ncbi:MAG TPA: hypothetical protein VNC78_06140 [Actinomycetota bacterium]|nr:hypothetical protein [Actinomycetota bacterium]
MRRADGMYIEVLNPMLFDDGRRAEPGDVVHIDAATLDSDPSFYRSSETEQEAIFGMPLFRRTSPPATADPAVEALHRAWAEEDRLARESRYVTHSRTISGPRSL